MLFVLSTLVKSEQVRSATVQPWRLLHVRLMLDPPLEKLGVYQRAWNVQQRPQQADPTDITGTSKTDQLKARSSHCTDRLWASATATTHTCLLYAERLVKGWTYSEDIHSSGTIRLGSQYPNRLCSFKGQAGVGGSKPRQTFPGPTYPTRGLQTPSAGMLHSETIQTLYDAQLWENATTGSSQQLEEQAPCRIL